MARASVISPYQKFYALDGITPLSGGTVAVYENLTTNLLSIYSDRNLTIPQTNPYVLDAGGAINGDVFYSGNATLTTFDDDGGEIASFDYVTCFDQSIPFAAWDATVTYTASYASSNIVQSTVDNNYYISIQANNLNHEPSVSASWWQSYAAYIVKILGLVSPGYVALGDATTGLTGISMVTKGGILAGDGTTAPQVLAVGANGLHLEADSGETTGLKWVGEDIPIVAAGGTVDAITATYSPAITLTDQQRCMFVGAGANTVTTPTFAPNGLTARTITMFGGQALVAGSIGAAGYVGLLAYNLANTRWELLNPVSTASTPSAAQGASLPLLSTVTASNSATADVETTFDSTYSKYIIEISGLTAGNDGAQLQARMKIGGSYLATSTYYFSYATNSTGSTDDTYNVQNLPIASVTTEMTLAPGLSNNASASLEMTVVIDTPSSAAFRKKMRWKGAGVATTSFEYQDLNGVGGNTGTDALTGIRFFMSAGNILAGTFRLYALKNS